MVSIYSIFYFIICMIDRKYLMSTVNCIKLQINGPSGHCSHLDFHPPPEVEQPSPVR